MLCRNAEFDAKSPRPLQQTHNSCETNPLPKPCCSAYIPIIERGHRGSRNEKDFKMANSFFRNAYTRMVEARERQVSRYVNGALLNLDDKTLESMGTSRAELRRKGANSYVF